MRVCTGRVVAGAFAVLLAAGGCGAGPAGNGSTTTVTVQEPPGTVAPPAATQESAPRRAADRWVMPDLVGATLQDAQDRIQSLTAGAVFFTGSHDLGGQDRNQVLDSNWQVCSQNVAPGATLTPESRVDFGVVKLGESCP
ncbi:PASTA domain-containing protein [Actinophytocola sp. KF-1]